MNDTAIINKSDNKSKSRAVSQSIHAKLYKVSGNTVEYTVTSSTGNKQYLVRILLLDLTSNKLKSLRHALSGNLKISCSCDAFLYQGYKFISWVANVGIDKETRSPDIRNPNKEGLACKHILVALDQMKSDYNAIHNMVKVQVPKGKDKPQPEDIKDNSNSDKPTELDIKIVTDFKNACDKLYNDYVKFTKSDHSEDDTFVYSKFYDKVDPSSILKDLSKPVAKSLSGKFIGKLKSLEDILSLIDQKKNGFNILLDSDVKSLIRKLNSTIDNKTEAFINDIILSLMYS